MKIEFSAKTALGFSKHNETRAWVGSDDRSACARLQADKFIELRHVPKFQLDRSAPIFTVGSCFARNVENTLLEHRLPMLLRGHGVPAEEYETWDEAAGRGGGAPRGHLSRGALNKYNVHSMTRELRRVILEETYPHEGLIELKQDLWFDPHASALRNGPYETVMANRRRIHAAMAEIRNARVMFMTLGLTETWIDKETGLALNVHPGANWLTRLANRFQFVDYGFDGILSELVAMIDLIRSACSADMRFIVTVSPVPLGSTFKNADVIVANGGSKATLRAVAEELTRQYDCVDYFPSYEYVINSPRSLAWGDDQLHVNAGLVRHITESFIGFYYGAGDGQVASAA